MFGFVGFERGKTRKYNEGKGSPGGESYPGLARDRWGYSPPPILPRISWIYMEIF